MNLRPYQIDAVDRCRAAIMAGQKRGIIVAPTGAGKTIISSYIIARARALGKRVLFVAHRRELINQSYNKLIGCTCSAAHKHDSLMRDPTCMSDGLPESDVGIIMAGDRRRRPNAPVQVASIDTIRNRSRPVADIVIVDESHRALAKSYLQLNSAYPDAVHLGLTATPWRMDGRGLGEVYEFLVVVASPRVLIEQGYLVEPRVFTVPAADLPDLSRVKMKGGDYDQEALSAAVDHAGLVGNILEHWQKHALGIRTVVFAASVAHSQHIAARFIAAGVTAEHLDGETPTHERDGILRRLELGQTLVVCNYGVLGEGYDQPAVKCAILARPTKSTGLYLQQAGRILRPYNGQGAIILDHAGVVLDHGLPQEDREFTLEAVKKSAKKQSAFGVTTCTACFALLPAATRVCPECGAELAATSGAVDLTEQAGELVEVRPVSQAEKREAWDALVAQAANRGYSPGWASHEYRKRFGVWPPKSFPRPVVTVAGSDDTKRAYLAELRSQARSQGYDVGWVYSRFKGRYGHDVGKIAEEVA